VILLVRLVIFLVALAVVGLGSGALVRLVFPDSWARLWRKVWRIALVVAVVALFVWYGGRALDFSFPIRTAAPIVAVILMAGLFVLLTAPLWALLGGAARKLPLNPSRRSFLGKVAGAVPMTAALAGPAGAVSSAAKPVLREVDARSPLVPKELDGYRILQLSDVHLGAFIDPSQVEAVVEAAREKQPHLVALTGDIADDYDLLPPALASVKSLGVPMLAILGNHEVYRGRDEAVRLFEQAGAKFLCDDGVVLEHQGFRFWVAGTDDPAHLRGNFDKFYARSVATCAQQCPPDVTTKLLLAHRPLAFDVSPQHGFAVQLSGHTHGAQMALFGRSLLEGIVPMKYLLGLYEKNGTVLFTTAGLGHWFPFRLNCPTEAAIVTLRSA
jgi:predicted MPP superfamily phosphohydrolase